MTGSGRRADPVPDGVVLDVRGLRCPAPVIRLARATRDLPAGTVVTVWWTDPAARHDIPAWARMRGHDVVGTAPLAGQDDPGTTEAHATELRLGARAPGDG